MFGRTHGDHHHCDVVCFLKEFRSHLQPVDRPTDRSIGKCKKKKKEGGKKQRLGAAFFLKKKKEEEEEEKKEYNGKRFWQSTERQAQLAP